MKWNSKILLLTLLSITQAQAEPCSSENFISGFRSEERMYFSKTKTIGEQCKLIPLKVISVDHKSTHESGEINLQETELLPQDSEFEVAHSPGAPFLFSGELEKLKNYLLFEDGTPVRSSYSKKGQVRSVQSFVARLYLQSVSFEPTGTAADGTPCFEGYLVQMDESQGAYFFSPDSVARKGITSQLWCDDL